MDIQTALDDFIKAQGRAHVEGVLKTIPKKRDKTRTNVAKKVKFIRHLSFSVITNGGGIGISVKTERIEGSLLDVTAEWLRQKGLSEAQYSVWAVAKTLAREGVADVVFINNRRLKKMKDAIDAYAAELQLKLGLDLTKNFSIDDLKLEI